MPLQPEGAAPYAPPGTIISVIERARERGLPNPVTKDVLIRAGVPESLVTRTLQSLQLLEYINEDGGWTQNLETLRRAPESEFQKCLAENIHAVYADVFQFVNPEKDSTTAIRDAFRAFTPHGQQDRMVTLFVGLCQKAGIISGQPPSPSFPREKKVTKKTPPAIQKPSLRGKPNEQTQTFSGAGIGLPAPLTGLLSTLPTPGKGWTQVERNRFMKAFEAMLDYSIPIVENSCGSENGEDLL